MAWYVTYDLETGAASYEGPDPPPPPDDGFANTAVDPPPVAGQTWDAVTRSYPPPPDPALGGQADWYVYVDGAGAIQGGGNEPAAPAGLEAVKLDAIPDGTEDWDPAARRFAPEQSVPALLLRGALRTLLGRLETIEVLQDRMDQLGLPADAVAAVQQDLADRRGRLLGLLALAVGDYAQAIG